MASTLSDARAVPNHALIPRAGALGSTRAHTNLALIVIACTLIVIACTLIVTGILVDYSSIVGASGHTVV